MTVGGRQPGRRAASRTRRQGDDRADAGRQSVGVRAGRDAPGRIGQALSRKARARTRSRATRSTPASTCSSPTTFDRIPKDVVVLDRARLLPFARRARRAVLRLRRPRLLDRHRHAGEIRPGAPRHVRRPVCRRHVRQRRSAPADCRADARIEEGARLEAPCFIDSGAQIKAGAVDWALRGDRPRRRCRGRGARSMPASSGPIRRIGQHAEVDGAILARNCHVGRNVTVSRHGRARRQDRADGVHEDRFARRRVADALRS